MLLSLPFLGVETVNSMYNHYLIEQTTIKKDVFYRMKNNPGTCWRIILWLFACKFRNVINDKSIQDSGSPRCFIIDDSTLPKSGNNVKYRNANENVYVDMKNSISTISKIKAEGYNAVSFCNEILEKWVQGDPA